MKVVARLYLRSEMVIVKWVPSAPSTETVSLENYWNPMKDTKIQRWYSVSKTIHRYNRW